jgi:hypothetical protein
MSASRSNEDIIITESVVELAAWIVNARHTRLAEVVARLRRELMAVYLRGVSDGKRMRKQDADDGSPRSTAGTPNTDVGTE